MECENLFVWYELAHRNSAVEIFFSIKICFRSIKEGISLKNAKVNIAVNN